MVICAVLATISAGPDPKKYKSEVKTKEKQTEKQSEKPVLSDEERKFLREVEVKFGIKPEINIESSEEDKHEINEDTSNNEDLKAPKLPLIKPPFPAVIAIEIVNDTDTKLKGKRTIDANLGYGYRTNNGYTYSYFGKPAQEKGKFMIYPYSQEDIPPANPNSHSHQLHGHKTVQFSPNVEIIPSQAYELIPTKGEETSYNYEKPAVQLKTKYDEDAQTPPRPYPMAETPTQTPPSSTLYTTYNGKEFSSLSEQFPQVMSNYLVHPSQLVNNPQYQNAGLTQEHLRSHGANVGQRVVPVLVLRIPSSYIKNPTAELYANLPQNYPLSQYLNHLNLQQLVNEYFRKIGYSYAPQVMAYPHSPLAAPERHIPKPVTQYAPQQYASPYVQPSYTHADYSGVQYSAVQPVMARYPAGYMHQQYYVTRGNSIYQQPHQKYLYMYRYIPPTTVKQQSYYVQQPQYQQPESYQTVAQAPRQKEVQEIIIHEKAVQSAYAAQQAKTSDDDSQENLVNDEQPHSQNTQQYEHSPSDSSEYEDEPSAITEYGHSTPSPASEYGPTKVPIPQHHSQSVQIQYDQNPVQKEVFAIYHRSQAGHNYNVPNYVQSTPDTYTYQNQNAGNGHSSGEDLVLTENYPSKDHTIATVFPASHKSQSPSEPVQAVSYVTPSPTMKYHSRYRVMVPQTILKNPSDEQVVYVNSHSVSQSSRGQSSSKDHNNPEEDYASGSHYVSPVGRQRQPSYPRNYHAHPKRTSRSESKSDTSSSTSKKQESNANKKST